MAVISFHSLEDKIVKEFIKKRSKNFQTNRYLPQINEAKISLENITKKVITPSKKEIEENSRASSAKMRVAKKISNECDYKDDFDKSTYLKVEIKWND